MNFDLISLLPEFFIFLLVLLLFFGILIEKAAPCLAKFLLAILPLCSLAVAAAAGYGLCSEKLMFWGSYKLDMMSQFFKLIVAIGFTIAVINARRQPTLEEGQKLDYFLFLSLSAWGLILLASAAELVTIYLAMEMASYSLYVLIPLRAKDKGAAEAGLKYILFGAAATALALFGLSWIFASQGTSYLAELMTKDWSFAANPMACVGLSLFLGGMFYKLALFPFHFWCPDVYQGASNETAAYVATLPKLGAVIVLIRLASFITPGGDVANLMAILSALTITVGNLCALVQKDLKRMLGFSSVAHAGYILVGLVAGNSFGLAAAAFYAFAYVLMNLLCFWILSRIATDGRNLTYKDLNGLSKHSPIMAMSLAAAAFSLVGLPPSIGFIGKLWLISATWDGPYFWLVIVLCLNSAIAIYYYLSLVRHAFTEGENDVPKSIPDTSFFAVGGAAILALAVVLLGIIPAPVFDLTLEAAQKFF